jgi:hypothetical protein
MDKRTVGIIATIATVLLCGCPGLFAVFMGVIFAVVSFVPNANIDIGGSNDPKAALAVGGVALCLGIIFIIIPIVVGFLTLRKKPAATTIPVSNEPLPPTY